MGGVTGSLLIGIFAWSEVNGIYGSWHQFWIQLLGVASVVAYTAIVTWIIFKISNIGGSIKVPKEVQEKGLDQEYLTEEE